MRSTYDVIVAGVGAVGSATLHHLAARGLRVLGLEQFAVPHALGGSHGFSRQTKIAPYVGGPYEPIIRRAYELFAELVAESGQPDIMVTTGFLDLAAHRDCAAYRDHRGHFEELDAAELRRRYPQFRLPDDYWGAYDPRGALLRPELTIASYVRLALERGADVLGHTRVLDWRATGGGVSVTTDRGDYQAGHLVLCGGPWMRTLLGELGVGCTANRVSFAWFWPVEDWRRYLPAALPSWCLEDEDGIYYGFPMMTDVPGFKIGLHWPGAPVDPDRFDRAPTAHDEELVRKGLRRYLPGADGPLVALRTCLYDHSPDDVPIIDRHPLHDRVTLCGPLCSAGFKFVPAYGEIAADFVEHGRTELPSDFLRIARLLPAAGR